MCHELDPDPESNRFSRPVIVCSVGIGIELFDEERGRSVVEFLIHRNDPLPASHQLTFATESDDQNELVLSLWEQGTVDEDPELDANRRVLHGRLGPLPTEHPRGTPVHVIIEMDAAGVVTVTAHHPGLEEPLLLRPR